MAVMSALVYYVLPGLIGRAYDLKNDTVGPDLFRTSDTAQAKIIQRYTTTSEYRVVSELSEATDFLDVSGKLALKLKTGAINIEGTGNYLKEAKSFEHRVDLLVKVHYETIIKTLPITVTPVDNWQDLIKDSGSTHYIRAIKYGGDLIASVRFTTANSHDKETIKAEVQGELNAKSGSFGAGLNGSLESIKQKIGDSAFMDINYYATVPLENIARTIKGLSELVDSFPEKTKQVNDGIGVPLSMEVFSLTALNQSIETYYQTLALADHMLILDEQLSDIRSAQQRLSDWLKTVPPVLPDAQEQEIGKFNSKLESIDRVFCDVIANLDLSKKSNASQFKPAFKAYQGDRKQAYPNMYVKELSKLKKQVLDATPSFETEFGGANYNYWGSNKCPGSAKLLFEGIMSTTDHTTVGSSEFTCMPNEKQYVEDPNPGNEEQDIEDLPQVQPVVFVTRKVQKSDRNLVTCANCRVPGKSASTMVTGTATCPPKWVTQYTGILISTDYKQARGELVCLDVNGQFPAVPSNLRDLTEVTEVSPKCGSYPCSGEVKENRSIPCAVCSITKESNKPSDYLIF